MARPDPSIFLPLWDRALDPDIEIGIAVKIGGITAEQFRASYLYAARKGAPDPSKYASLVVFLPQGEHSDEVWICKSEVELGPDA